MEFTQYMQRDKAWHGTCRVLNHRLPARKLPRATPPAVFLRFGPYDTILGGAMGGGGTVLLSCKRLTLVL